MMRLKILLPIIFSFLIILALANDIEALGIGAHGDTHFLFEPNKKVDITVTVSNSLNSRLPIITYVEGETEPYFTLHGSPDVVLGPKGTTQFTYTLTMPERFDTPGEHNAFIYASQLPPESSGGGMAGIIRIGTKIYIHVPYPGKYIDVSEFNVHNPNINQKVLFKIKVVNRGSLDVENLYADIDIYDAEDKIIDSVTTNTLRAVPNNEMEIIASWLANTNPGRHKAKAVIYYDGETVTEEKIFNLGSPSIKITGIKSDPIENGTVGKIEVYLKSEWNLRIDNVFANLIVKKKEGNVIADLRSETIRVEPWSKPSVNIFWDTKGIGVGNYTGTVTLHYLNKTEIKETILSIVPLTANVKTYLMYIAIFVMVLILLVGMFILKKKRKKPQGYYIKSFK